MLQIGLQIIWVFLFVCLFFFPVSPLKKSVFIFPGLKCFPTSSPGPIGSIFVNTEERKKRDPGDEVGKHVAALQLFSHPLSLNSILVIPYPYDYLVSYPLSLKLSFQLSLTPKTP